MLKLFNYSETLRILKAVVFISLMIIVSFSPLLMAVQAWTEETIPPTETTEASDEEVVDVVIQSDWTLFWGAYFKNELSYWDRSELQEKWGDFNKFRFFLEGRMSEDLTLRTEIDVFSFHGNKRSYYSDQDTIILDRAYIDLHLGELHCLIGKQEIRWGPDSLWSPTDIFTPFDLTMFHDDEREGESAITIDYRLSELFSLGAVVTPAVESKYFRKALQLKFTIEDSMLQLSYIDYSEQETEKHFQLSAMAVETPFAEGKFWFETAFVQENQDREARTTHYLKSNIGLEYTTSIGVVVLAEFFYDSAGKSAAADYTEEMWREYLLGRTMNLGQIYGYLGLQALLTYSTAVSTGLIKNYSDQSSYYYISGMYRFDKSVDIICGLDITHGPPDSEFTLFGNSYTLALKIRI